MKITFKQEENHVHKKFAHKNCWKEKSNLELEYYSRKWHIAFKKNIPPEDVRKGKGSWIIEAVEKGFNMKRFISKLFFEEGWNL